MKRALAVLAGLLCCSPAWADYTATQGAGTTFWAQTISAKQMPTFGIGDINGASIIYAPGSTTAGQSGFDILCRTLAAAPTDTTGQSNIPSCTTAGELRVNIGASGTVAVTGTVAATQSGTWTVQPGNTANTTPWLASINQGGNTALVKTGNTSATTDVALVVSDANVVNALNNPVPQSMFGFGAAPTAFIPAPASVITYTANTGWCGAAAACNTVFTFANACRVNGGAVLIPTIDIWSDNNPALKLQGILWLFTTTPSVIINDNATFNINGPTDFPTLTGNQNGFAFTLASAQASGAANSGTTISGTTYHAQCGGGSTSIIGMVQVVNAYVRASGEKLHVTLHTVGVN